MKNPITFKDGVYILSVLVVFMMITIFIWSLFGLGNIFNSLSFYYNSKDLDGFLLILLFIVVITSFISVKVLNEKG